jgi:type I restriction enzyme S subunit
VVLPGLEKYQIIGNLYDSNTCYLKRKRRQIPALRRVQEVLSGEFLINPLNLNYDLLSLRTALSEINVVVSTGYIVLLSNGRLIEKYTRWLLQQFDVAHMKTLGSGVRQTINYSDIGNSFFFEPSQDEQTKIANFLDHETAKIDILIDKQQQLIKLLKEKRQAVISHAVTKGLNPAAPMKDSGVEWLGEVPEHWVTLRIKQIASFITSGPRGWSDFISEESEDIFLQSGDLNNELEILPHKAKKVIAPKGAEGVRTKLIEGDVVVCITGANTGRVAVVQNLTATTYINQHLSLIRPIEDKVDATFIGYALSSQGGRAYFDVTQYGLKEGLSLSNVAEAPLPLPPLNEQKNIVQDLHARLSAFSRINGVAESQVELLKERRTALISAAVTGKIDVRNWQPAQPKIPMEASA